MSHRATTAHLQAIYPFVTEGGLILEGPLIGRDVLGGPFCFDPWALYQSGQLTNPNVLVLGQLGRGKSTFIKTMVWRQVAFGRRAWIIDPKGEYDTLAGAAGSRPVVLVPGGSMRLNPLDLPGTTAARSVDAYSRVRPRLELTASLVACSLGRALSPDERTALEIAVRAASDRVDQPVLGDVVHDLLNPDPARANEVGTDGSGLRSSGRIPALELRRMIQGDLAGMFDGPTSIDIDFDALVSVLDLSATFSSPALPLIMTCATAWLQSVLGSRRVEKRLVVVDEAWAILADLATARWSQSAFKLSRAFGVSNVVVVHRLSDLRAAGADGSAQQKLADGLLADSETRVVFGQPASEAENTGRLLGLSRTEVDLVSNLPRGVALWRVGNRQYLVEHLVGLAERAMVDTDAAMIGAATA